MAPEWPFISRPHRYFESTGRVEFERLSLFLSPVVQEQPDKECPHSSTSTDPQSLKRSETREPPGEGRPGVDSQGDEVKNRWAAGRKEAKFRPELNLVRKSGGHRGELNSEDEFLGKKEESEEVRK